MTNKPEKYDLILNKIQNRITNAQRNATDVFSLYLEIGKLILLVEQECACESDQLVKLERDLKNQNSELGDWFTHENLRKMKSLFITYKLLIHIASDLKIGKLTQ